MVDVAAVLEQLGIEVVNKHWNLTTGEEWDAHCPYHYEGTSESGKASWSINAETGKHRCWSCGFSGRLPWLLHKVGGVPLSDAIVQVGEQSDLSQVMTLKPWAGARVQSIPPPPMGRARLLTYDKPPSEALEARKLSRGSADAYEVRWDAAREAWVTPIKDPLEHDVIGLQLKGPDRFFRNVPLGVEKGSTLFGVELLPAEMVVLVESPLDAVRLHSLGYVGISCFGAQWSAVQLELIIRHCHVLVVALDNDDAGRTASLKMLGLNKQGQPDRRLTAYDRRIRMRFFNYGGTTAKDVGDMEPDAVHAGIDTAYHAVLGRLAVRPD